ncbi:hypothetical protein [Actinophytocola sp.]|uniref:lytic transglycosylase domain-containing protein n=1 Tax=Actinophytocola sp. TaxID=1872138 RepID=UPI002D3C71DB|nr:hypothetical protein [Actinophytocola sp.]HYQ62326.1 hypothetical protein [Actinophytocola sp.]
MSAANGRSAERRLRRRRRKLAAATSTVLLVAAAVAGEPISLAAGATQVAGGIGGGLKGMTDPDNVGASGRMNDDDEIGDYLKDNADDVDSLLKLGGDAPTDDQLGIPGNMLEAYMNAADMLAESQPSCNLDWSLIASVGRIESNHARGGKIDDNGDTVPKIFGPVLDGGGFAAIRDSDGGRLDGDNRWDRAVGAMQFIPTTWTKYASDGNDDGVQSPHNVYDETLAAGKFLCSGNLDLSNPADRAASVFRYNHSDSYVATVLLWADAYADGVTPMPDDYVPTEDAYGPPSVGDEPPPPPTNPPPTGTPGGGTTSTPPTTPSGPIGSGTGIPTSPHLPTTTTTPPCTATSDPTTTTSDTPASSTEQPGTTDSAESTTTTTETTTTTTTPSPTC